MIKTEYDEIKTNLIKKSLEKESKDVFLPVERRKGCDGILNFVNLICILIWGAILCILAITVKAGKSITYICMNDLLFKNGEYWELNLLNVAFAITIGSIVVCTFTIILNFTRKRRRSDKIKKSLIISEILCFIIGFFLIFKIYNF